MSDTPLAAARSSLTSRPDGLRRAVFANRVLPAASVTAHHVPRTLESVRNGASLDRQGRLSVTVFGDQVCRSAMDPDAFDLDAVPQVGHHDRAARPVSGFLVVQ